MQGRARAGLILDWRTLELHMLSRTRLSGILRPHDHSDMGKVILVGCWHILVLNPYIRLSVLAMEDRLCEHMVLLSFDPVVW